MQITPEQIQQVTPYAAGGSISITAILFWICNRLDSRVKQLETSVDKKPTTTFINDTFQTTKLCDERSGNIENTLTDMNANINTIKDYLIKK